MTCRCESNFTCGHCLANAKPWHFTPDTPAKLPVNTWDVTISLRSRSAIGCWWTKVFRVRAETEAHARKWAFQDAQDADYEVDHVIKAERIS